MLCAIWSRRFVNSVWTRCISFFPLASGGNIWLSVRPSHSRCIGKIVFSHRDQVGDEFCYAHSAHLRKRCERQEKQREDRHLIGEFVDFVKREDLGVVPVIGAIAATGTLAAGAEFLGTTEQGFCRKHTRLRQLATYFANGEPVPQQRKPYRTRHARWERL